MVTMESPTLGSFLAMRIALLARKRTDRRNLPRTWIQTTVRLVLHLAGFSLLTMAGFQWNMLAGLIVAGISCFVLSTLLTTANPTEDQQPTGYRR
jgi:hypothetical protein